MNRHTATCPCGACRAARREGCPLDRLTAAAFELGATLVLSSLEGLDGKTRPKLLAVVKPAPTVRWKTRRLRLRHGTTLASCDLEARPVFDDAASVLLDVLEPVLAELHRREAA